MEVQSSVDLLCPCNAAITEALLHRKPAFTRNLEFVCNTQFSSSFFSLYGASTHSWDMNFPLAGLSNN
jgi:hypothetical protein